MNLSKSQINKVGKEIRYNLRDDNEVSEESLEKLQAYRISHQEALNSTFDFLVKKSKYHYKGSLTVYRLKRIDTIVRKIGRYKTMSMSTMQDIAGCRSIVGSERQIYNIVEDFEKSSDFEIVNRDNYIENPRDTGYISYHIIVKPVNQERLVEIQLRTRSQHFWATLVEITDVLFDIKLKEGEDHPELYKFHKLLAKGIDKLSTEDKIELVRIDRENQIISKVTSLFKSNYYVSIDRWGKANRTDNAQYLIMELDQDLSPVFYFYEGFLDAEIAYFNKFALNEPNMVLVHINEPDFEKIGLAYSNYVLTSHPSIRLYIEILQGLIIDFKNQNKEAETVEHIEYYSNLINEILKSFQSEIDFMNDKIEANKVDNVAIEDERKQYLYLIRDWRANLSDRFKFIEKSNQDFYAKLEVFGEVSQARNGIINKIIHWIKR